VSRGGSNMNEPSDYHDFGNSRPGKQRSQGSDVPGEAASRRYGRALSVIGLDLGESSNHYGS
jgi:hypothetical protein